MVVTFGGCHSEYHHINDLNLFDLTAFLENPKVNKVICTKITQTKNVPSTRWGHGAAVYENSKLLFLGRRTDNDISDLHQYDIDSGEWSELLIAHPLPKPRRRASVILVSNCMVMFGGFDGEFFNDMNVLSLKDEI